jgi:hypothetical protein
MQTRAMVLDDAPCCLAMLHAAWRCSRMMNVIEKNIYLSSEQSGYMQIQKMPAAHPLQKRIFSSSRGFDWIIACDNPALARYIACRPMLFK